MWNQIFITYIVLYILFALKKNFLFYKIVMVGLHHHILFSWFKLGYVRLREMFFLAMKRILE